MALLARPTKSFQTLHDKDYYSTFRTLLNARALLPIGQTRAEVRCPICGGTAWITREEHNSGQAVVAACDDGCFMCRE